MAATQTKRRTTDIYDADGRLAYRLTYRDGDTYGGWAFAGSLRDVRCVRGADALAQIERLTTQGYRAESR